ncbi:DUF378 domain-containing protein [Candidatus Parcubacteria bacterium]|nr:DUF378 domain-containing protein [Candidatus Parcubacteria bacterium]
MKLHTIAFILLIIGGLNWLLEAFGYGIGNWIPGKVAMTIYILVGLSAIYEMFGHKKLCRNCNPSGSAAM